MSKRMKFLSEKEENDADLILDDFKAWATVTLKTLLNVGGKTYEGRQESFTSKAFSICYNACQPWAGI